MLQGSDFVLLPLQSAPSPEGGGFVHVLRLTRLPPPQVLSHGGLLQDDHPPSSPVRENQPGLKYIITFISLCISAIH